MKHLSVPPCHASVTSTLKKLRPATAGRGYGTKDHFTRKEEQKYNELKAIEEKGLSQITAELVGYRKELEK